MAGFEKIIKENMMLCGVSYRKTDEKKQYPKAVVCHPVYGDSLILDCNRDAVSKLTALVGKLLDCTVLRSEQKTDKGTWTRHYLADFAAKAA